ncbi:YkvA family protein [Brevibacillus dissolubilis]|uniref:YkvA family protein n=1 Tax=Brevibacillus dissolubilis TaxID=1844116 RepID=UPI0011176CF6|nr:YkvA family protein [Brevibacillus dissolubilis]
MVQPNSIQRLKSWARTIKRDVYALYVAYRDERTPLLAKLVAVCVVAYAFSPIDLIPDFIPILGYLDDVILVPLGILLAVRLIPADVMADCREKAVELMSQGKRKNWLVGGLIILLWISVLVWLYLLLTRLFF